MQLQKQWSVYSAQLEIGRPRSGCPHCHRRFQILCSWLWPYDLEPVTIIWPNLPLGRVAKFEVMPRDLPESQKVCCYGENGCSGGETLWVDPHFPHFPKPHPPRVHLHRHYLLLEIQPDIWIVNHRLKIGLPGCIDTPAGEGKKLSRSRGRVWHVFSPLYFAEHLEIGLAEIASFTGWNIILKRVTRWTDIKDPPCGSCNL